MSQSNDELVAQFSDITGVDAERARFYLEASIGNFRWLHRAFIQSKKKMIRMRWYRIKIQILRWMLKLGKG
ncbi:hypothetical protein Ocin01_17371 [Orchesella cincta]|uniref:Uncharacterized protein n=1 Tax=Orchesella cincta TaxID=48709 RepID=A0A1D2M8Q4_ORCCI|nr:hypothetical protein Ocin01_17371 [Orchesella cincta]